MSPNHERLFDHHDANHLDSAERRGWLPPEDILDKLGLAPGMSVADIGAGTGYFALPIAERVTPRGRVHAVDIQPEMLARLSQKLPPSSAIELVHGSATATSLPDKSQRLIFYANVWHEFDDHAGALREAERVLQWGGRVAIVDWRTDHTPPPGPPAEHRVAGVGVTEQLRKAGWRGIVLQNVGAYSYLVTAHLPMRYCACREHERHESGQFPITGACRS